MTRVVTFEPRFVKPEHLAELSNLWHLSRTAAGENRHRRLTWVTNAFHEVHDYVSPTGVYKDLTDMLSEGGR